MCTLFPRNQPAISTLFVQYHMTRMQCKIMLIYPNYSIIMLDSICLFHNDQLLMKLKCLPEPEPEAVQYTVIDHT